MKNEFKNRWMAWAIVILAVMNITTFLTIIYERNKVDNEEVVSEPNQVQSENSSMAYSGRYFRDQLNLSRDQMNRFIEFNPNFRQRIWSINLDMDRLRHQMVIELAKQNCDTGKLNILSDSIGALHANLKKVTCKFYLDIKNICNQQQQEKLEQIFDEMFASNVPMGQNGMRGREGRGRGRGRGWTIY